MTKLGIKKFQAKIGLDNQISIAMFKQLHFQEVKINTFSCIFPRKKCFSEKECVSVFVSACQVSVCQVFKELTLELVVDESLQARLLQEVATSMQERDYRQTSSSRQQRLPR